MRPGWRRIRRTELDKSDALDDFNHLRTDAFSLRQLNPALWYHPNLARNACEHGVALTDLVPFQDSLRFSGQLRPKPFVTVGLQFEGQVIRDHFGNRLLKVLPAERHQ